MVTLGNMVYILPGKKNVEILTMLVFLNPIIFINNTIINNDTFNIFILLLK